MLLDTQRPARPRSARAHPRPYRHGPSCRCPDCDDAGPLFTTLELADAEAEGWDGEVDRSSSPYVRWVQGALDRIDGARLAVDGIGGTLTRAAVRNFQSRRGLAADGIVGPMTEAALVAAGAGTPPGTLPTAPRAPTAPVAPAPAPGVMPRLSVPESALIALLPTFAAYSYAGEGRYPWPVPGVAGLSLAPPQVTNCCMFVESVATRAWSQRHGGAFVWDSRRHAQVMIMDAANLFSPIDAYVGAGMASALPDRSAPTSWCIVQGWTRQNKGHTFIVVARHAATDRVLTLEANLAFGLNGVGCRSIGMLRNLPGGRPPARWWETSSTPTWAGIAAAYDAGVRIARLGVTGQSWAGLSA